MSFREEFAARFERHRGELQVHCYRMLGSLEDAEDLVQETFLRAWRRRASFGADGRSSFRAWLYRIATNACLDVLRSTAAPGDAAARSRRLRTRRVRPRRRSTCRGCSRTPTGCWSRSPRRGGAGRGGRRAGDDRARVPRRDPAPAAATAGGADPPRRARLVGEGHGVAARGKRRLGEQRPPAGAGDARDSASASGGRSGRAASEPSAEERELLRRYVDAHERADVDALAALLREDARLTMPPHPTWFEGREAIVIASRAGLRPGVRRRCGASSPAANRQPAVAHYLRAPGEIRVPGAGARRAPDRGRAASPRSPRSCTPSCSRRSGCRRLLPSDEFSARSSL